MLKPGNIKRSKAKKSAATKSTTKKTVTAKKVAATTVKKATAKKPASTSVKKTTKKSVATKPNLLNFNGNAQFLFDSKLTNMVNLEGFLQSELSSMGLIDKTAQPTPSIPLSKEEKLRLDYDGLSTPITAMSPPIKLVSFGNISHLRWWDTTTLVQKPDNFIFDARVSTTEDESFVISRIWSQANQHKRFYVKYDNGRLVSLDTVNKSNIHFFFINDALAEDNNNPIVLCEGYRAAAHLREHNINAIGTIDGGTLPDDDVLLKLKGKTVLLWPDNDDVGMRHMSRIRARLLALEIDADHLVKWEGAAKNADAADVNNVNKINALIGNAQPWPLELIVNISRPAKMKRVASQLKLRANSIITRGGK